MTEFKPTEDQLFDFYLGQTDRTLSHQIENYLTTHPDEQAKFDDYKLLEDTFKQKYPLSSPSELTLERVRKTAQNQLKPRFFDFLKIAPARQQLAWVAVICLVIGLTFFLRDIQKPTVFNGTPSPSQQVYDDNAATMGVQPTTMEKKTDDALRSPATAFNDYVHALSLFHQEQLPEACALFGSIMSKDPTFEKRTELYSYWIDALNKMGDTEQAKQREEELKEILERQSTVNGGQ